MENTQKRDVYAEVTGKIITALENGVVPWRKPWGYVEPAQNHFSGHKYRGINALLFLLDDYKTPYFGTMRQVNEAGGRVKKGTKSTQVYFHDCIYKDKNGARLKEDEARARIKAGDKSVRVYPFIRIHPVFNMQDVEGCPVKPGSQIWNADNQPLEVCRDFIEALEPAPAITHQLSDRAYYDANADAITVPDIRQFASVNEYYSTLFHELAHWTGHASRLNRKAIAEDSPRDRQSYGREELTAEITTTFLCNAFGIETPATLENSTAYISTWLGIIKKDKRFVWDAATDAQAAFSYLFSLSQVGVI